MAIEHSNYEGNKWGVVPTDATLRALQRKASTEPGSIFHIVRLSCMTAHPEQLPIDPQTQKPAKHMYLFKPTDGELDLMREVHRKE